MHIPSFPIAVAARAAVEAGEHEATSRPLVLAVGRGAQARVRLANEAALNAGVRPGLHTVARARACTADLDVQAWDDALYDRAQQDLATHLLKHTPAVTRAGLGLFWFDATGQERLGGESALTERILQSALEQGYPGARVAVASSAVAAEVACRLPGGPVSIIPPRSPAEDDARDDARDDAGPDARFLAQLPLDILPLDPELLEVLGTMGLQRVGELASLPATSLELRFGAVGLMARDLALGRDPRAPLTCGGPQGRLVELTLEPHAHGLEPLLFGTRAALVSLLRTLDAQGGRVARLRLHLRLEPPHSPVSRDVAPSRPSTSLQSLLELCRATLEGLRLGAPVTAVAVEVVEKTMSTRGEQGDLFKQNFRDADGLEAALSRIRARCGPASVARPVLNDEHRPELQGLWVPDGPGELQEPPHPPPTDIPAESPAPSPLPTARRVAHPPLELPVRESGGRPQSLRLDRRWLHLFAVSPVRRLSSRWWESPEQRRQDRLVITADGARLLISRPDLPGTTFEVRPDAGASGAPIEPGFEREPPGAETAPGWKLLAWDD